jgi:predicted RNase H-like nuclease (RuvC/YqgF family)
METNQNSSGTKKLLVSALIALALVNAVTLYFMFSEKKEKQEVTAQKDNVEQDYKNISDTLDAKRDEIGKLRGQNADMDKQVTEKQAMIDAEKSSLDSLYGSNKLTATELNRARRMITTYEVSIASLQKQVAEYEVKTQVLTQKTEQLSTDLNCEKETTSQLTDENQGLSKKVDAGSYFQIAKVDVEAVKKKHDGKEVAVDKAKAAESLKISFETGVNKVLDPGKVCLYVRIINPKGETIAINEQGSGIIPTADETAKPIEYTKKADINWTQSNKKIVMYWNRYIKDPGVYRVEVYQSGKVVGHGAVHLI